MNWLQEEGLVIAVDHEPLSFMRRAGYAGVDEAERFDLRHAEETIRRAAENGVNALRAHFYKGSGYVVETEERERVAALSKLCRKYGIHLQLYVQFGTIAYETMRAEQPDVLDWVQKDKHGTPITLVYGHQSFRYYPCFNSPGYWTFLENILRDGLEHYDPDMIGLDNITTGEEPNVCHCVHCREGFVRFLKEKYDPTTPEGRAVCMERFGHAELDHIQPPEWNYYDNHYNLTEINNPLIQEWIEFRMQSTTRIVNRMYAHIKSINPDVLVEINAYKMFGVNTAFINGLYLPDFQNGMDLFWNECDPQPCYTEEGQLLHRIRSYKMARAMDKLVFTTSNDRRGYAESMAFNQGLVNGLETLLACAYEDQSEAKRYQQFRLAHRKLFDARPVKRIALYESRASLCYSNFDVWYADILMHTLLLTQHLPFDLLLNLNELDAYQAIILPDMRCLEDAELERLTRYAEAGGTLVLTGEAGDYDAWHRTRRGASLRAQAGLPQGGNRALYSTALGKGQVLWVPKLTNDHPFTEADYTHNPFHVGYLHVQNSAWLPPHQSDLIADRLRQAVALSVDIDAPPCVVTETTEDAEHYYVHLVNLSDRPGIRGIRVQCAGNASVRLYDVDSGTELPLTPDAGGFLTLPPLDVYAILQIDK